MAGFFDTLFGGGAEKEAADANRALIAGYQPQALGALQHGLLRARRHQSGHPGLSAPGNDGRKL